MLGDPESARHEEETRWLRPAASPRRRRRRRHRDAVSPRLRRRRGRLPRGPREAGRPDQRLAIRQRPALRERARHARGVGDRRGVVLGDHARRARDANPQQPGELADAARIGPRHRAVPLRTSVSRVGRRPARGAREDARGRGIGAHRAPPIARECAGGGRRRRRERASRALRAWLRPGGLFARARRRVVADDPTFRAQHIRPAPPRVPSRRVVARQSPHAPSVSRARLVADVLREGETRWVLLDVRLRPQRVLLRALPVTLRAAPRGELPPSLRIVRRGGGERRADASIPCTVARCFGGRWWSQEEGKGKERPRRRAC
mmetsp:Transcript_15428/g.62100  ORF Transcript_15428/g.62100 Transcript_15428/m.62100 type:complete len:319 (-) Transcript_15428:25-981(-)